VGFKNEIYPPFLLTAQLFQGKKFTIDFYVFKCINQHLKCLLSLVARFQIGSSVTSLNVGPNEGNYAQMYYN